TYRSGDQRAFAVECSCHSGAPTAGSHDVVWYAQRLVEESILMTSLRVVLAGACARVVAMMIVGAHPQAQGSTPAGATFRTPWGDPDIQGIFTTDDELGVPFERPEPFGNR